MSKVTWVIENFSEGKDITALIEEVRAQGHALILIDRKTGFEYKHVTCQNQCVVFYGSIQMAKLMKEHLKGCRPAVMVTDENYPCHKYYSYFKKYLFNDGGQFYTVADLMASKWEVYQKHAKEALIFVRPDNGDKTFSGQLLDLQDFDRFWSNNIVCNAKATDFVYVDSPKTIQGEWRFTIDKDYGIITCSCYKYQGQTTLIPSAPEGATRLVEEILKVGYHPDPIYTIDVAQDSDGHFWLLELNSWCSAGMYAGNMQKIVAAISLRAEIEWLKGL